MKKLKCIIKIKNNIKYYLLLYYKREIRKHYNLMEYKKYSGDNKYNKRKVNKYCCVAQKVERTKIKLKKALRKQILLKIHLIIYNKILLPLKFNLIRCLKIKNNTEDFQQKIHNNNKYKKIR